MRKLLLDILPFALGKKMHPVECDPVIKHGQFSLTDYKACHDCKRLYPARKACDENVLMIDATIAVETFDFESFISQWDNTPSSVTHRCDYLMWDDAVDGRKIAFCDLTCSVPKHVDPNPQDKHPEGKRLFAYAQMQESLDVLLGICVLDQYLLTATKKVFIFGWRDPEIKINPSDFVEQAMGDFFTNTAIYVATTFTQPKTYHGFDFVQVKYPAVYKW